MSASAPDPFVETMRGLYERFARGDVEGLVGMLDPAVVWSELPNPYNPSGGTHRGHAGFADGLRIGRASEEILELRLTQVLRGPDSVAVVGTTTCRARSTGKTYTADFVHLVTYREGKVIRFQEFFDTFAAAETFRSP